MGFGENLKTIRKQKNITQEELAGLLDVSRQAVSKWESGNGYPETEKLLMLSKELDVSLDYLMGGVPVTSEKEKTEEKSVEYAIPGKIAITTFDNKSVVVCHTVRMSNILWPGKNEPGYILNGIDKITFWGREHTTILGWYATLEDIEKEIKEIMEAINKGDNTYKLKYNANIEYVGLLGQPKIKD
ncbi:MAG: helix-turn-helix transcriptional regulator [Lachnospiraceae bacterium]|nr:helix-turn-helix transcriptional regulator [Lachnospiraceae bacterium]